MKFGNLIFIFMVGVGLTTIAIISYIAYIIEVTLIIVVLPFAFFWLLWIKRSGWNLLPEKTKQFIKNIFMKNQQILFNYKALRFPKVQIICQYRPLFKQRKDSNLISEIQLRVNFIESIHCNTFILFQQIMTQPLKANKFALIDVFTFTPRT